MDSFFMIWCSWSSVISKIIIIHLFAAYSHYYDKLVGKLEELQIMIPEAKSEIAAIIPSVRCQQNSINKKDKALALKCLKDLAPKALAGM